MPASTDSQGGEAWTLTQECAGNKGGRGGGLGWDLAPYGLTAQLTRTSKRLLAGSGWPHTLYTAGFWRDTGFLWDGFCGQRPLGMLAPPSARCEEREKKMLSRSVASDSL